jgi:hypothetical protein
MLTDIIPDIINEPVEAGCAPGNETIGYLAGEISRLRYELRYIADAAPAELDDASNQFHLWAQNRAKFALEPASRTKFNFASPA